MHRTQKIFQRFTGGINIMVVTAAAAMILIGVLQILFRYVFRSSLSWSEECMRYLHVWVTLIGGSLCFYEGMFTTINLFFNAVKKRSRTGAALLLVLQHLTAALFFVIMLYYGILNCQNSWVKLSSTTRISMGMVYLCVPLSGLFGLVFCAAKIPRIYRELTEREEL